MSGGVDSSVAALLLRDSPANADRRPVHAELGRRRRSGDCRAEDDRRDAVARLRPPRHADPLRAISPANTGIGVFAHFLAEYAAGRTPNPDVLCNREIKFKHFLDAARALGAERIATGHYARVDAADGRWRLLRAHDRNKDQSYFLHQLGQAQLAATLFPLGDLPKPDVRRIAARSRPADARQEGFHRHLLHRRARLPRVPVALPAGEARRDARRRTARASASIPACSISRSASAKACSIGGVRGFAAAPWYVVGKDVERNVLFVDQGSDSPWLQSTTTWTEPAHWIAGAPPAATFACTAQTRYRQHDQACEVTVDDDGMPAVRFDATAARGDAGPIAGALRRRRLPRRRGHRCHRRAA